VCQSHIPLQSQRHKTDPLSNPMPLDSKTSSSNASLKLNKENENIKIRYISEIEFIQFLLKTDYFK